MQSLPKDQFAEVGELFLANWIKSGRILELIDEHILNHEISLSHIVQQIAQNSKYTNRVLDVVSLDQALSSANLRKILLFVRDYLQSLAKVELEGEREFFRKVFYKLFLSDVNTVKMIFSTKKNQVLIREMFIELCHDGVVAKKELILKALLSPANCKSRKDLNRVTNNYLLDYAIQAVRPSDFLQKIRVLRDTPEVRDELIGLFKDYIESDTIILEQVDESFIRVIFKEEHGTSVIDLSRPFRFENSNERSSYYHNLCSELVSRGDLNSIFIRNVLAVACTLNTNEIRRIAKSRDLDKLTRRIKYSQRTIKPFNNRMLPFVLISYPRSGSNYLQNVMYSSTGVWGLSMYGLQEHEDEGLMSIKSHSLSLEGLKNEYKKNVRKSLSDAQYLVYLYRDPRDVMISFYEYSKAVKKLNISQEEFIHNSGYYFLTNIDRGNDRQFDFQDFSPIAAYKMMHKNWFQCPRIKRYICFDDLVAEPKAYFHSFLDDLGFEWRDNADIKTIVSKYSEESIRERGVSGSWKGVYNNYKYLIDCTVESLVDEMKAMGLAE